MRASRRTPSGITAAALAFAALASAAVAADPGSRQTRDFVQAAAQSDTFEIMAATTVLAESEDAEVLAYARQMIEAHRRTTADLMRAVAASGLAPPAPGMSADQAALLAGLQGLRGSAFDRTYLAQQMQAHHSALVTEQGYAADGDDAALRAVAAAAVPVVTAHLRMLGQIHDVDAGS